MDINDLQSKKQECPSWWNASGKLIDDICMEEGKNCEVIIPEDENKINRKLVQLLKHEFGIWSKCEEREIIWRFFLKAKQNSGRGKIIAGRKIENKSWLAANVWNESLFWED